MPFSDRLLFLEIYKKIHFYETDNVSVKASFLYDVKFPVSSSSLKHTFLKSEQSIKIPLPTNPIFYNHDNDGCWLTDWMRMILPPLVFPGGTLRVRACFMLARVMDKCSPQGCAHPLHWPERVSEKDREREINRESEWEKERVFIF